MDSIWRHLPCGRRNSHDPLAKARRSGHGILRINLIDCLKHGDDILRWDIRHDVVDRIENKPPAGCEDIYQLLDMVLDLRGIS